MKSARDARLNLEKDLSKLASQDRRRHRADDTVQADETQITLDGLITKDAPAQDEDDLIEVGGKGPLPVRPLEIRTFFSPRQERVHDRTHQQFFSKLEHAGYYPERRAPRTALAALYSSPGHGASRSSSRRSPSPKKPGVGMSPSAGTSRSDAPPPAQQAWLPPGRPRSSLFGGEGSPRGGRP